jgi:hypothetical protein
MPEIVDDVKDEATSNGMDGAKLGLGLALGNATFGPIGYAGGGLVAGSMIDGSKGDAVTTYAVGEGINRLINQGMTSGGSSGGRQRM